jgi:hypothetical protein
LIRNLFFLVLGSTLFTLAYTQAPLYTSNQNQYFLHGLARAGFGFLNEDWLVSTLDPTPVFSKFIEISWRLIPWRPVFHLYYGILAGVYLFSMLGIVNQLWGLSKTRSKRWIFLTILVILHSAALRYVIVSLLGQNWDYLFDGGVAGQRLLGTVLQPSTFGVFLILSIYLFLRSKNYWAILCLLVATTFHPTYLLSALFIECRNFDCRLYGNHFLGNPRDSCAFGFGAVGTNRSRSDPLEYPRDLWQHHSWHNRTSP